MTYNTTRRHPLKDRAAFLAAHGGRCYYCGELILPGQIWHDEHIIARELGGSDDMDNRRPIHAEPCHRTKTAWDRKLIAHSNRIRRKHGPIDQRRKTKPIPSRPLPSRPFQSKGDRG